MFPRSLSDCIIERDDTRGEKARVLSLFLDRLSEVVHPDDVAIIKRFETYTAKLPLGARGEVFEVNVWWQPAITSDGRAGEGPLALFLHGHGHSCCVASWSAFFPALARVGFSILAIDAPGFGQSSGPAGQANLWRGRDAFLTTRLLEAFGCNPTRPATVFAQCMGGAMFLRALAER